MKVIFIAGPYFGNGDKSKIQDNIRHAEQYQIALANAGIGFFCPHNHTEHFEIKATANEDFYRTLDMVFCKKWPMRSWRFRDGKLPAAQGRRSNTPRQGGSWCFIQPRRRILAQSKNGRRVKFYH